MSFWSLRGWREGGWAKSLPAFALLAAGAAAGLGGCDAQQPWPLWEAYTKRFLDGQGRVIDRSAGDRTTSEGEAYAMFFALVDNDRGHFEKLVEWTEANLAGGDLTLRLPAWDWGKNGAGEWKVLDDNSASDADLWMAYSLMEAGRLWKEPRYDKLGRAMAARIAKQEVVLVPGLGTTVEPGPTGFHPEPQTWVVNPSYVAVPVIAWFAKTMPQGPWPSVLESLPKLVGGASEAGFCMDWVAAGPDGIRPSGPPREPTSGEREAQAAGSYDAIRVYLWVGMADGGTAGVREMQGQLAGMGRYLSGALTPPLEVNAQGKVVQADGPPGFSAAVVPLLVSSGLKKEAAAQQDRLLATRDLSSGLYGRGGAYYDQNLALFSTGWTERRFRFDRDGRLKVSWR